MAAPYVPSFGGTSGLIPTTHTSFGQGLLGDIEGAVTGLIPSLKELFTTGYHDLGANIHGHPTGLLVHGKGGRGGQFGQKVVLPAIRQQQQFIHDPIGQIKQGHILLPIMDALTILSAGGGRIAAAGMTPKELGAAARTRAVISGKYEGPIKEITARLPSGEIQVLKTLPRSGYRAKKALTVEAAKRKTFGTSGIIVGDRAVGSRFGTEARAAKVKKKEENAGVLSAFSDPRVVEWQNAYQKLGLHERMAFHIKARLPLKKDLSAWKLVLEDSDNPAAKQTLDLINKPEVQRLYNTSNPKLDRVMNAWHGITDARQEILLAHGAIDPFQVQEGLYRHTMLVRGALPLTKSKAYNQLRGLDAQLKKNERQYRAYFRTGSKAAAPLREVGKDIKAQIEAGRKAAEAELPPGAKASYVRLTKTTDAKFEAARAARQDWRAHFDQGIYDAKDAKKLQSLHARMEKAWNAVEAAIEAEHGLTKLHERAVVLGAKGTARAIQGKRDVILSMRSQYRELLDARRELVAQRQQLEALQARIPKSNIGPLVGGYKATVDQIKAEFEQAGVPQPGYIPDVRAQRRADYITTGEGSIGPPRPGADVYPSTGVMFRHGIIDLTGDHITASFLRAAKHQRQANLHDWAMKIGVKVPRGGLLPDGYEWVKTYRGQRIPYSATHTAEHIRSQNPFDALDPDEFDQITSKHAQEAALTPDQRYNVAVPKAIADQFRADFASTKGLGTKILRKATNIWRGLLLRVRIGWLENNIIGNTIMASIRFAGVNGLRAYLSLIGEMAGPKKVLQLLNMDVSKQVLTPEQWSSLFPQALRGTHIETQLPKSVRHFGGESTLSKTLGAGERAVLGKKYGAFNLLPNADRWYESFLRKGGVLTTLRKQPEVRAIYDAQKKDTKSWGDAMAQAVEQNPHLQRIAVQEMNDALGDFLSLSRVEREQIRQLIPFYAWFREILRVTAKTVVDTPGRALLLTQLGQIGNEATPQDVPSYLKGGIPVSGLPSWLGGTSQYGQQQIISTRAMTPYSTPLDLIKAGASLLQGNTGAGSTRLIASELNPYLAAILNQQRRASIPGIPLSGTLLGQPLSQAVTNLPEYRAAAGPTSTLYPTRGALDRWFQAMAGSPFRTYDIGEASSRKALRQ